MAKVKFVLNRKGVRSEILRSPEIAAVIRDAAESAAPSGTSVTTREGRTRTEVRIADNATDALVRESKEGHLSRILGQVRV